MSNHSPIPSPPPELVQQWAAEARTTQHLCNQAARWGADQELEACCELVPGLTNYLRAARRPNPPSLKEQALEAQMRMWSGTSNHDDRDLVRRALEQLPN